MISPLARKLAQQYKIDTARVKGTGPGDRIVKEDVLKAVESRAEALPTKGFPAKVIPMVGKRKAIAERSPKVTAVPYETQCWNQYGRCGMRWS